MPDAPELSDALVPVCAMGASAGGVEGLREFFARVPGDLGLAYVVIVHLVPDQPSALADILAAATRMPVHQVDAPAPLRPDCVYVIPPDRELSISDDRVEARPFSEPRGRRAPIDMFFRSVAQARGDGLAVILSGAGSDGAAGVRAVKEAGGIIFVQDPAGAEFAMMPRSAMATGAVDFVAPIPQLIDRMIEVVRSKEAVRSLPARTADAILQRIVSFLHARTGHDFSGYKRATVLRRVSRRMQICRCADLAAYGDFLAANPEEANELFDDLLISVTSFFRDPAAYEALARAVVPALFDAAGDDGIRAWVVGCATGEEAYSLAILLQEERTRRRAGDVPIQIFATDLDEGALATAREGRYPEGIEADVSEARLAAAFVREGSHYRIRKEIRDLVLFAPHSVLRDPPFMRLDLVSCRNLLIYLDRSLQREVCALFAYGMRPGAYLFLGSAETTDTNAELFAPVDREARLYRARGRASRRMPVLAQLPIGHRPEAIEPPALRGRDRREAENSAGAAHINALERAAPPSVLVGPDFKVRHLSPRAGHFLMPSAGSLSLDVGELVRPELRLDLRAALRTVLEGGKNVITPQVPTSFDGTKRDVMMHVSAVGESQDGLPSGALVVFLDSGRASAASDQGTSDEVRRLRDALRTAEGRLAESRVEHEDTIQNLRIANEELQSVNEEYRSTSEELETSKEELQSMNEELQTVNAELKQKLENLGAAHGDLENLIAATDIGTLFLDPRRRIRMFTPRVARIFNITDGDVGREVTDFTHRLRYPELEADIRSVLDDLAPLEREVRTRDGRWLMVRLRPYRTLDDRIDGVVFTFIDLTERRETVARMLESEARFRALASATSEVIFRMSPDWSEMLELQGRGLLPDTEGACSRWAERYILPEDWPEVSRRIREAIDQKKVFDHEHRVRLADGEVGWTVSRAVPMLDEEGRIVEWFGAATDVTERHRQEDSLREARDALAMATAASRLGWGAWDFARGVAFWDERSREINGLADDSDSIEDWLSGMDPLDRPVVENELATSAREARTFDLEYRVPGRDGGSRIVHVTGAYRSREGEGAMRAAGLVRDVTELREWAESQRLLIGELNHRVKNMLAVVKSVAGQTQRFSPDIETFMTAFGARLQAIARAHSLLTQNRWSDGDLREVVVQAVAAFRVDDGDDRVEVHGPGVRLKPQTTVTMALALHELGTNAIKYGALSVPGGRVRIAWRRLERGIVFEWIESDGPRVRHPKHAGFGTELLKKGVAWELDAAVQLSYLEDGLRCRMEFTPDE